MHDGATIDKDRRFTLNIQQNVQRSKANQNLQIEIEERKRGEEALKESEERFKDISHSTADWIWEVDINGEYTFASGTVKEILGYDPDDLIGKTPFELMPER